MKYNKTLVRKRIVQERERAEISQTNLAKQAGIAPSSLCMIETGQHIPSLPVMQQLADALNVSIDYLAGSTEVPEFDAMVRNEKFQTFYRNFRDLDAHDKRAIMDYVEYLKQRGKGR